MSSLRTLPSTVPALSVPVTTVPVSKYCAYDCCANLEEQVCLEEEILLVKGTKVT